MRTTSAHAPLRFLRSVGRLPATIAPILAACAIAHATPCIQLSSGHRVCEVPGSGGGQCGDFNGDGFLTPQDVIDYVECSASCTGTDSEELDVPWDLTDPQDIIDLINSFPEQTDCDPDDDLLCSAMTGAAATLFQSYAGRLPSATEMMQIEIDAPQFPEPKTCDIDPSWPQIPPDDGGGIAPIICVGISPVNGSPCDPANWNTSNPDSVPCVYGPCEEDLFICQGVDCSTLEPFDITLPIDSNWPPDFPPTLDLETIKGGDPSDDPIIPYPSYPSFPPGFDPEPSPDDDRPERGDEGGDRVHPDDSEQTHAAPDSSEETDDTAEPASPANSDDDEEDSSTDSTNNASSPCGSQSSNQPNGSGSGAVASEPVDMVSGHKIESAVDLRIATNGPDFVIRRAYTSNTAFQTSSLIGNHWNLSTFISIREHEDLSLEYTGPGSQTVIAFFGPAQDRLFVAFKHPSEDEWLISGASNTIFVRDSRTIGADEFPVWRLSEPGRISIDFFREATASEVTAGMVQVDSSLLGAMLYSETLYGQTARYDYEIYGANTSHGQKSARLKKIYINESDTGDPEAEVWFQWFVMNDGDPDVPFNHPFNGRLARVMEVRRDSGQPVETQRVEYTYKHAEDGLSDDLGSDGDLIRVTRFRRVDDLLDAEYDYSPAYPHRSKVTLYRYHNGVQPPANADERLEAAGREHQLKAVMAPEQVEFYAQQLHRGQALTSPAMFARDAAIRLMRRNDSDIAFRDEGGQQYRVVDVATKWIGYDLGASPYRVSTQYTQSPCGCASGPSHGRRLTYDYTSYSLPNSLLGASTKIAEHGFDGFGYGLHLRNRYYDNEQIAENSPPYLRFVAFEDPISQRVWAIENRYQDGRVSRRYTISSIASYQPATTSGPASVTYNTEGAVFQYEYTDDHRRTTTSISTVANLATPTLLTRRVFPETDGAGVRTYLPIRIEKYTDPDASPVFSNTETAWIEYGFRSETSGDPGYHRLAWVRRISPAEIDGDENGPASTGETYDSVPVYSQYELYDERGRLRWIRRPNNVLVSVDYDDRTGRRTSVTRNADPLGLDGGDYAGIVTTGWGGEPGGELTWSTERDLLGRVVSRQSPEGITTRLHRVVMPITSDGGLAARPGGVYYALVALPHRVGDGEFDGPATVQWQSVSGRHIARARFTVDDPGAGSWPPSDPLTVLGDDLSRFVVVHAHSGSVREVREWHDVEDIDGFYSTRYTYDVFGRLLETIYPDGSIGRVDEYDILGRPLAASAGSEGEPLTKVVEYYYDDPNGDLVPEQGVGNGRLSWLILFPGEDSYRGESETMVPDRRTFVLYDWRDRPLFVRGPEAPYVSMAYDNIGRLLRVAAHKAVSSSSDPTLDETDRIALVEVMRGRRGLPFRTRLAIDPSESDPAVGSGYLEQNAWYDAAGRQLAARGAGAPVGKFHYDAHGRVLTAYTSDAAGGPFPGQQGGAANASSVAQDRVLQETHYTYTDGTRLLELVKNTVRVHDRETTPFTGPLTDTGSSPTGVSSYVGYIHDGASRVIATVDFGSNSSSGLFENGPAPTWPPSAYPDRNDPAWEETRISEVFYNERGLVGASVDPEGRQHEFYYDSLGRLGVSVRNAQTASVAWDSQSQSWSISGVGTDSDRITSLRYDARSRVIASTVHLPGSNEQTTAYLYGTLLGQPSETMDSLIASASLLREVRFPHPDTGLPAEDTDPDLDEHRLVYAYNALGELRGLRDQNATVHAYTRDTRGRVVVDTVESLDTNLVDDAVRRIEQRFDTAGRPRWVRSYDAPTGGSVVNAVSFQFDQIHRLTALHQAPVGDLPSSPGVADGAVLYAYQTSPASANNLSRIASLTYPLDAEAYLDPTLTFDYGPLGGIDDLIGRIVSIDLRDDNLVTYDYLGLSAVAVADIGALDILMDRTYANNGARRSSGRTDHDRGHYPGWDRFGRVVRHAWILGDTEPDSAFMGTRPTRSPVLEHEHTYDRVSNRLSRRDARRFGAFHLGNRIDRYTYDGLDRLAEVEVGHQTSPTVWRAAQGGERWSLDALGNWDRYERDLALNTSDDYGTYGDPGDTDDDRSHNSANQITEVEPASASASLAFQYTPSGAARFRGTTTAEPEEGYRYTHDAWDRLVRVEYAVSETQSSVVSEYEYNGMHQRTVERSFPGHSLASETRFYYDAAWRLIESRTDDSPGTSFSTDRTVHRFWGLRRIDDAIARLVYNGDAEDISNAGGELVYDAEHWLVTDADGSVAAVLDGGRLLVERVRYTAYGLARHSPWGDATGDGSVGDEDFDIAHDAAWFGDSFYHPDLDRDFSGDITPAEISAMSNAAALPEGWISERASAGGTGNEIGYAGYIYDRASDLYTARHRQYDPRLGRWLQRDPAGYVDGFNLYQYVNSSPIGSVDPYGLFESPLSDEDRAEICGRIEDKHEGGCLDDRSYQNASEQFGCDGGDGHKLPTAGDITRAWWKGLGDGAVEAITDPHTILEAASFVPGLNIPASIIDSVLYSIKGDYAFAMVAMAGVVPGGRLVGQLHHAISTRVHRALQNHPILAGVYKKRDSRLTTRAADAESHRGYQTWHREYDSAVSDYIERTPDLTREEFERYLRDLYRSPDLSQRFPDGL